MITPSFVKLNELIPEGDWEYFEDREMSMREAAGRIVMKDVTETLDQRETRYGSYVRVATTAQWLKEGLRGGDSWNAMEPYMQESWRVLLTVTHSMMTVGTT